MELRVSQVQKYYGHSLQTLIQEVWIQKNAQDYQRYLRRAIASSTPNQKREFTNPPRWRLLLFIWASGQMTKQTFCDQLTAKPQFRFEASCNIAQRGNLHIEPLAALNFPASNITEFHFRINSVAAKLKSGAIAQNPPVTPSSNLTDTQEKLELMSLTLKSASEEENISKSQYSLLSVYPIELCSRRLSCRTLLIWHCLCRSPSNVWLAHLVGLENDRRLFCDDPHLSPGKLCQTMLSDIREQNL